MIDIDEPVYFTSPEGRYRVTVSYDSDTDSPRTWTNGSVIHTFDSNWNSPDGERCQDRRHRQVHPVIPAEYVEGHWVDMRRAERYVNLFGPAAGILTIVGINRSHDGTLSTELYGAAHNSGDVETNGYAVVTTESWEETQGKAIPFDREIALRMIESEIEVYNKWQQGEFTMVTVEREVHWQEIGPDGVLGPEGSTMTTWDTTEVVGGFDDADAAFEQGSEMLPEGSEREA
jgi:hypothetical protein